MPAKLKNTSSKEFRATVRAYLANSIYDDEGLKTERLRIKHIWRRFRAEYDFEQNRRLYPSLNARVASWLSGLPLSIDFDCHGIIGKATDWHEITLTDAQEDMIIERWFDFLASQLIAAGAFYDVPTYSQHDGLRV